MSQWPKVWVICSSQKLQRTGCDVFVCISRESALPGLQLERLSLHLIRNSKETRVQFNIVGIHFETYVACWPLVAYCLASKGRYGILGEFWFLYYGRKPKGTHIICLGEKCPLDITATGKCVNVFVWERGVWAACHLIPRSRSDSARSSCYLGKTCLEYLLLTLERAIADNCFSWTVLSSRQHQHCYISRSRGGQIERRREEPNHFQDGDRGDQLAEVPCSKLWSPPWRVLPREGGGGWLEQ